MKFDEELYSILISYEVSGNWFIYHFAGFFPQWFIRLVAWWTGRKVKKKVERYLKTLKRRKLNNQVSNP